jgi:protocatechuate 3,4-dioxygenase beta subunit
MSSRSVFAALVLVVALAAAACAPSTPSTAPASSVPAAPVRPSTPGGVVPSPATAASEAPVAALECTAPVTPTSPQSEGPFYVPGAPGRADLVDEGMEGTVLVVSGFVVDTDCTPLANATVDVWQADAGGEYDNSGGYRLRGYVLTDASGRYAFRTVVPGEYPGRPEHIHVKVTPEGGSTLTTQLYFPGNTANEGDNIFSDDLLLDLSETTDGLAGSFTFVVEG